MVFCWVVIIVSLILLVYFFKMGIEFFCMVMGVWFVGFFIGLIGWCVLVFVIIYYMYKKGLYIKNVVIIGMII